MHIKLVCQDAIVPHGDLEVTVVPATLGRGDEADHRLGDRFASRLHCQIDVVDGRVTVRDIGSANGTYVNGERIDQAVVSPGDLLTVGASTFRIEVADKPARLFGWWRRQTSVAPCQLLQDCET
jgi:predicted component of type VI protein secretion system